MLAINVSILNTFNAFGVLVGREVDMFELVPKVRQRQCIVVETDRKSVPSRRSSMTERVSSVY